MRNQRLATADQGLGDAEAMIVSVFPLDQEQRLEMADRGLGDAEVTIVSAFPSS